MRGDLQRGQLDKSAAGPVNLNSLSLSRLCMAFRASDGIFNDSL